MQELALSKILSIAGARMLIDLNQQLITHPGELGTEREEIIRGFLRSYLPKRFEVSTGFVFDAAGRQSKQMDIIIADSTLCPRFETAGAKRIFPCESVVACGQVKSSLTSVSNLKSAFDNLESVKALDRSANGQAIDHVYHEALDHKNNHLHQIFTFIFITGKAIEVDTLREELLDYVLNHQAHLWPNVIIALDRYLVTFCCDNGVCPNPMDARGIAVQRASAEQNVLFRFYALLGRALEAIRVASFPYNEYLDDLGDWEANVLHSTRDDPPPYLSNI